MGIEAERITTKPFLVSYETLMPDFSEIDQTMKEAIKEDVYPGAVLLAAKGEEVLVPSGLGSGYTHTGEKAHDPGYGF